MTDDQIVQFAGFLLALVGGGGSVLLVDWLKNKFSLKGHGALIAAAVVATVIAILDLIVQGQLSTGVVNWANLPEIFTLVFVASQARFHMLRNKAVGQIMGQAIYNASYEAATATQLAEEAMAKATGRPRLEVYQGHGLADEGNHRDN